MKLEARTLQNRWARLEPVREELREAVRAAANHERIWDWFPKRGDGPHFDGLFDGYLERNDWHPFVVFNANGEGVGMTSYINPRAEHAGVEIGGTWYAPSAQATAINPATKHLLMSHAFESGAERVELKTDAMNARSRSAILKLGATFEGIHRHHMRRRDGTWRDTAWYSVLREEWSIVRAELEERLAAYS